MKKGPEYEIEIRIAGLRDGEMVVLGPERTGTGRSYELFRTDGGRLELRVIHVSGATEFSTVENPGGGMLVVKAGD